MKFASSLGEEDCQREGLKVALKTERTTGEKRGNLKVFLPQENGSNNKENRYYFTGNL